MCQGSGRERISPARRELGRLGSRRDGEHPSSSKRESGCEAAFWRHRGKSWKRGTQTRLGGEGRESVRSVSKSVCVDLPSMVDALL